jgi:hypothetical protein
MKKRQDFFTDSSHFHNIIVAAPQKHSFIRVSGDLAAVPNEISLWYNSLLGPRSIFHRLFWPEGRSNFARSLRLGIYLDRPV